MEHEVGTWDSVLLENLTEDCFIANIQQRYKKDQIYTYIGTSVVAINPYRHISENSLDIIRTYGYKGIFQLPPHIYGLANLAYQSLKDQNEDQCIILQGESGSGKTESFKMIVNFLTRIQEKHEQTNTKKQTSISADKYPTYRRTSSSCSANIAPCKSQTAYQRKSPSPGAIARKCDSSSAMLLPLRADSSDRNTRKCVREKCVDFDFSQHKSTEDISENDLEATGYSYAKSCFKSQRLTTNTASKKILLSPKKSSIYGTESALNKYMSTSGISGGCHLCGHSKCNRAQNRHQEDIPLSKMHAHRGSCSNLERQQSTESQTDFSYSTSNRRISLYEAHKLDLLLGAQSSSRLKHKTMVQKLRECVTCADVFLEAMGNAATIQNNNSSRYGKLFDIEIDYRGDPMGVHITHYTYNQHKFWRKKFPHILSTIARSRYAVAKITKTLQKC